MNASNVPPFFAVSSGELWSIVINHYQVCRQSKLNVRWRRPCWEGNAELMRLGFYYCVREAGSAHSSSHHRLCGRWRSITWPLESACRFVVVTLPVIRHAFVTKMYLCFTWGSIHLWGVTPASPREKHGDVSWAVGTPWSPVPASLHLLALQLKSSWACPVRERRSVRPSHLPPFWFWSSWRGGDARDRCLIGRGVLITPPFGQFFLGQ